MRVGDGGRLVAGIWQAIEQLPQSAIANLRGAWRRLYNASKLVYASIEQDWLLLKDVMAFLALAQRSEYTPRKCEPEAIAFITDFKNEVLWWLAHLFDTYIREVYLPAHGGCDRPPGALSRDPSKRKYVQMHPEAVWQAIQEARETGCSLATVLVVRKKDDHAGTDATGASRFMAKHHMMYNFRRDLAFRGVRHLCAISDPSIHSKRDMDVTVFWSWETKTAAFGDVQEIVQQKQLLPADRDLPNNVAARWDMPKQTRVASFHELQALSHTIHQLTSADFRGIWDFKLPQGVILRPVQAEEERGEDRARPGAFDRVSTQRMWSGRG